MLQFHATVHAAPAEPKPTIERNVAGQRLKTIDITPTELAAKPLDCTFEEAESRLSLLERMFIEPDGSFVWVSDDTEERWQLDGNLYDHAGRLRFVDIKGRCTAERFDEFLGALGWPEQQLVFQLVRHAVVVDEEEFRRWAEVSDNV